MVFAAAVLTALQLVSFSRVRSTFPPGMTIANVPVGRLTQQQAADRLIQVYGLPVELRYGEAIIQVRPSTVGFELDLDGMLAAADLQRVNQPFWSAFWDYLWNRATGEVSIPLSANIQESRLRAFLKDEIAARYDQPPSEAVPVPGSTTFQAGKAGSVLEIDRAVLLIEDALRSPSSRAVNLTFSSVSPARPSIRNLAILLEQIISVSGFDGLAEVYVLDLQNNQEVHFAVQNSSEIPLDIAFTAASTIKIPIMISVFRRINEPAPKEVIDLIELMIERSENDPADRLMDLVLDQELGPLRVTADMQAIGLTNTFLGGYFYPGAPLLRRYSTPANQRTDISTDPDIYNQTTPQELGLLLNDIYQCALTGGGTFAAAFPGEITQNECRAMISYLARNRIAVLLEAGLPEGVQIAHKHGWITSTDGLIHTIGDTGIVYTPGGNYIITVYLYHPVQLLFDPANQLVAQLSSAVYNYYNLR